MKRRSFLTGLAAAIASVFLPKRRPDPVQWIPFYQDAWQAQAPLQVGDQVQIVDVRHVVIGQWADSFCDNRALVKKLEADGLKIDREVLNRG